MLYLTRCDSPLGPLTLASDGEALCGLWLEGQRHFMAGVTGETAPGDGLPVFVRTQTWLARYFAGGRPAACDLPLSPEGSDFRRAVWRELCGIPYGETTAYGRIAERLALSGARTSARAVGGAVARNPISIVIPCHRVLGADGGLTGYAGGVERKRFLLRLEGALKD